MGADPITAAYGVFDRSGPDRSPSPTTCIAPCFSLRKSSGLHVGCSIRVPETRASPSRFRASRRRKGPGL